MSVSAELLALRDAITAAASRAPLVRVEVPLTLKSEANCRDKWAGVKRAKAHRAAVAMAVHRGTRLALHVAPVDYASAGSVWLRRGHELVVRLVRVAPRGLDSDNLARALKAVRDGVADALGIDDRNSRVVWLCDQQSGKAGVVVELYARRP